MGQVNPAMAAMAKMKAGASLESVIADIGTEGAEVVIDHSAEERLAEAPVNLLSSDGSIDMSAFSAQAEPSEDDADVEEEEQEEVPAAAARKPGRPKKEDPTESRFSKLESKLDTLADLLKLSVQKEAPKGIDRTPTVRSFEPTDEEIEVLGEDGAAAISKFMKDRGLTPELLEEIQGLKKQVGLQDEAVFMTGLREKIPAMDEMVTDPNWIAYTQRNAPFSGKKIGELLLEAHNARNGKTVREIFDTFAAETKGSGSDTKTLKQFVTPKTTGQSAPKVTAEKPVLLKSRLDRAIVQQRQGVITAVKLQEISRMYSEAQAEGRVDFEN